MKFSTTAILALANIVLATPVPESSSGLVKRAANAFAVGTRFNIDGSTNYFVGSNSYWISYLSNPADVDQTMAHLAASGLKVLRVWGFNDVSQATSGDWMQSFIPGQTPQINLGANGLGKLDTVVAAAEKYNIKLIIPMVNYWTDYGGMQKYTTYYGVAWKDFYTNAQVQAQYRTYVATVVNKYKASTSIFAWELANEPRCPGCATSVITNWATSVSAYIKTLDPAHMVTIGDEGFMNGGGDGSYAYSIAEGVDFAQNIQIPSIDFAVFHLYPEYWSLSAQPGGNNWFKNHAAVCVQYNKPCVAEEYSYTSNKIAVMGSWQSDSLASPGMAGDMFWQWGEVLPNAGTTHNDGHAIYYGSSDWAVLVRDHVSSANALGGGGGATSTSSRSSTTTTRSSSSVTTTTASRTSSTTTTVSRTPTTSSTTASRTTTTASRTTSSSTTTRTTTSATSGGATVPRWGKCGGGSDFTGPFICESPWTCVFSNPYYSQCL